MIAWTSRSTVGRRPAACSAQVTVAATSSGWTRCKQWRQNPEVELAASTDPKPRLHPGLADIYRGKVAALNEALVAKDGEEVREAIRTLIAPVDGKRCCQRTPARAG